MVAGTALWGGSGDDPVALADAHERPLEFRRAAGSLLRTGDGANDMPWGQRVAHIRDPDGHVVNLTQTL